MMIRGKDKQKKVSYNMSKRNQIMSAQVLDQVYHLAKFGCTNEEIMDFLHITHVTFNTYNRDYPAFHNAIQQGRLYDSMKVVDSLHRQALGYEVVETEEAEHMNRNGEVRILKKTTIKHIQPNVTAAIYLLKTRHGDKWMDIIKSEKTQNLNIMVKNVDFSDMSDDDLLALKKIGVKSIPREFRLKAIEEKTETIKVDDENDTPEQE